MAARPPATRGDCVDGPRPCQRSLCKWHLSHVYTPRNAPESEVIGLRVIQDGGDTCALDLADEGAGEGRVARALGVTRQRVRELEIAALNELANNPDVGARMSTFLQGNPIASAGPRDNEGMQLAALDYYGEPRDG